ncbi:MAG: Site-specific recombinase, invertase Pin s [Caulobacter sp.]|nr:Site-specific recombinase, invertase Pin s [Caulobacter sp.]
MTGSRTLEVSSETGAVVHTGERIRDKIAASKARGMWMGGTLPLGYDAPTDPQTRALVVNPAEADVVRQVFRLYLELGSVGALEAHLEQAGIRSKAWTSRRGKAMGAARLSRGALYHLLQSRLYLGEIPHGAVSYPGSHPAIIDVAVFEQVQAKLALQRRARQAKPTLTASMALRGLLFDANGEPMCPSFAYGRGGKVYRYYVSAPLQQGRKPRANPHAIHRVAADEVEEVLRASLAEAMNLDPTSLLPSLLAPVSRIEIEAEEIRVALRLSKVARALHRSLSIDPANADIGILALPIRCRVRGGRTWITPPAGAGQARRARKDPVLIRGLQAGHRLAADLGWQCADGKLAVVDVRAPPNAYDRLLCRLAFLAPDIQRAILQGRQPPALTLERLMHKPIPMTWAAQRVEFGMDQP